MIIHMWELLKVNNSRTQDIESTGEVSRVTGLQAFSLESTFGLTSITELIVNWWSVTLLTVNYRI